MLNKFGTFTYCTKNPVIDYHRLPRNNIARKNLSITLKDIFPSRGLDDLILLKFLRLKAVLLLMANICLEKVAPGDSFS